MGWDQVDDGDNSEKGKDDWSPKDGNRLPEDDRAPSLSKESPFELTLAQQLSLQQYIVEIEQMSAEECQEMAVAIMKQMMMKENLIKELLGRDDLPSPPPMPRPGEEPPDPEQP